MIEIVEGTHQEAEILESKLLTTLQTELPQGLNTGFTLVIKENNAVVAGLVAGTSYSWLLIKILWVSEHLRGQGVAKQLMLQAETKGKKLGCHSAWLDTSNPSAKAFYDALNYEVFGMLSNEKGQEPSSHQRWFMKKQL